MLRTTLLCLTLGVPASLFAQAPSFPVATANATLDGPYQINYASNLNLGDGVVNVTNTGASAGAVTPINGSNTVGDICVNVYVYAPDQEQAICCSCLVSPNSVHSWPVIFGPNALLANPGNLFAAIVINASHSALIKLLATSGASGTCTDPTLGATSTGGTTIDTAAVAYGMLAWGTHSHPTKTSTVAIGETPFANSALSQGEVGKLTGDCFGALQEGSGHQCPGCTTGGLALGTSLK
jgi:hypothetical protein